MIQPWKKLLALSIFTLLVLPFNLWAEESIQPKLVLDSIQQLSAQESQDELYFLISDLNAKKNAFYTIPGNRAYFNTIQSPYPTANDLVQPHRYWTDKTLPKLRNLSLWSRPLLANKGTQLVVTLIEADMPPWNLDDTLGSIKINLLNESHQLKVKLIADSHAKIIKEEKVNLEKFYRVRITNGNASYLINLRLIYPTS